MVLCLFLPSPAGVGELPLAQVNCFSGCPHHGLELFAHILTPPTLQLDFGSSASASLCISDCFHQFLNEGSTVTFKIFIHLIRVLTGVILVDIFVVPVFLLAP